MKVKARQFAIDLKLKMKISDIEYQGDASKATFYYTAEERVDFRELIKLFAREFKTRIEMRQVGFRQEALDSEELVLADESCVVQHG